MSANEGSESGSGSDESPTTLIIISSSAGGIALGVLVLFCIVFILLCIVMKRLRGIQRSLGVIQLPENDGKDVQVPLPETESSANKDAEGSAPSNTAEDPSAIEAMYSCVSREHCEKKKASLKVQQYDDIDLEPLDLEKKSQALANENTQSASHRENASVTVEIDSTGYSRLRLAGPRMSKTRKTEGHSAMTTSAMTASAEQLDSEKLHSASAGGSRNLKPYSKVGRPTSQIVTASSAKRNSYALLTTKEDENLPPIPNRLNLSLEPSVEGMQMGLKGAKGLSDDVRNPTSSKPYQNVPRAAGLAVDPNTGSHTLYSEINPTKSTKDTTTAAIHTLDEETFLAKFSSQLGDSSQQEGLYDVVQ